MGLRVLYGVELNIVDYDGHVDLPDNTLAEMDIAIASMHPQCYKGERTREMVTQAYVNAMQNPYVDIIGHPDDGRYPVDYEELVAAAKEHHVLLELNNSSLSAKGARKNPVPNDRKMLELCRSYKTPIIVNSDSHCAADVGNHTYADKLLKEMNFPEELIVNRSVEEYKKYTNRFRKQKQ